MIHSLTKKILEITVMGQRSLLKNISSCRNCKILLLTVCNACVRFKICTDLLPVTFYSKSELKELSPYRFTKDIAKYMFLIKN